MKRILLTIGMGMFVFGMTASAAQDKKDAKSPAKKSAPAKGAPTMSAAEEAEMKAMMEDAKLGPVHQWFAKLAGNYTTASKFAPAPGAPTSESKGTVKLTTALGGRFLVEESTSEMMGQPVSGWQMMGYHNVTKKYEAVWAWTQATSLLTMSGTSSDGGKTIVFDAGYDDAHGKKTKLNITWKTIDADHFEITIKGKNPDGTPGATMIDTYSRKK